MKIKHYIIAPVLAVCVASGVRAQTDSETQGRSFDAAATTAQEKLDAALAELTALREEIAGEKIPLNKQLNALEEELIEVRKEFQQTTRTLDGRTLDLTNLRNEIKSREEETSYLSNLLSEYIRNFESRLHIAEIQNYEQQLEEAKLAPENTNLSEFEVYETQVALLETSLDRLHAIVGGDRFTGTAVDPVGSVKPGDFLLLGPAAMFRSSDGEIVGTVEQRLGSIEPAVIPYEIPEQIAAANQALTGAGTSIPIDPTLGNAHVIEATKDTLWEHVQKGGPVMIPIFALAGAAFLVALVKWIMLLFVRKPSKKRIRALLAAIAKRDRPAAEQAVSKVRGPTGKMLTVGVEHLDEPRDLIEEVMYERLLATRLSVNRWLPFIAISAAAAPLLGLLGTVTGIINTFQLITVFGTGDVKTLSGGISEALITTKFGLIVAIPALLLHAFLSRKARGVIDQMEKAAVAFVNQVGKTPFYTEPKPAPVVVASTPPAPRSVPPKEPEPQNDAKPQSGDVEEKPQAKSEAAETREEVGVGA